MIESPWGRIHNVMDKNDKFFQIATQKRRFTEVNPRWEIVPAHVCASTTCVHQHRQEVLPMPAKSPEEI
jgi:hypothetical protein